MRVNQRGGKRIKTIFQREEISSNCSKSIQTDRGKNKEDRMKKFGGGVEGKVRK